MMEPVLLGMSAATPADRISESLRSLQDRGVRLIIASVGCQRGLQTGTGAVAVGLSTTRSVVAGILLTILMDGLFASVYFALGI